MYDVYIHLISRYTCTFDMTVYNVINGYLFHLLILVLLRYYLMYVKLQFRECSQVKSYRKSKRIPTYDLLEFLLAKRVRSLKLKIAAVSV
jgi:hypothetical protein